MLKNTASRVTLGCLCVAALCAVLPARRAALQTTPSVEEAVLHLPGMWRCPFGSQSLQIFWPSGTAPVPLLAFAHGMAVGPDLYYRMLTSLSARGFLIVAPTAGHTGQPGCDVVWCEEEYADLQQAIAIAYERRLELPFSRIDWSLRVGLVGHSMGGLAALTAATRPPPPGSPYSYGAAVAFSASAPANSRFKLPCQAPLPSSLAKLPLPPNTRFKSIFAARPPDWPPMVMSLSNLPANFTVKTTVPVMYAHGSTEHRMLSGFSPYHRFAYGEPLRQRGLKPHVQDVVAVLDGYRHDDPAQSVAFTATTADFLDCHLRPASVAASAACRRLYDRWAAVRARGVPLWEAPPLDAWCDGCMPAWPADVPEWQTQPANASCLQRDAAMCAAWTARRKLEAASGCGATYADPDLPSMNFT